MSGVEDTDPHAAAPTLIVAGNANVDLLLGPLAPWPRPGTESLVEHATWRVGGALGNTALALAGLGIPTRLIWDVGDDMLGDWLAARLASAGDPPRRLAAPTSLTVALNHPDGERTFVSHLGHLGLSEPDTLASTIEAAAPGDLLLVGGSFLLPRWRPGLPALLARARTRGMLTLLDTGWPSEGWSDAVRAEVSAALAHVDVFLPNLDEARGLLTAPEATPSQASRRLERLVAGRTVLKLGAAGAAYVDDSTVSVASAPAISVADTVGAGDTFNAALLCALRDAIAWPQAVSLAVEVASKVVASRPRRYPRWLDTRGRESAASHALTRSRAAP